MHRSIWVTAASSSFKVPIYLALISFTDVRRIHLYQPYLKLDGGLQLNRRDEYSVDHEP